METYKFMHSQEELRWWWDYGVPPLKPNEIYFLSLSCRNKSLTEEERQYYQCGRSEMFAKQQIRHDTWEDFLKHVKRFEVRRDAYLTKSGVPFPQKSLVVYWNLTPIDVEIFVVDNFLFVFFTVYARNALIQNGINLLHEIAASGISELFAEKINQLDGKSYKQYLKYPFYSCEKPEMVGRSTHLLFIGALALWGLIPRPSGAVLLGVRGICSPAYANTSRFNLWIPQSSAMRRFIYYIAVNILIRNIACADFTIRKNGAELTAGPVYDLFHRPNATLSRYDLWKETAAWWFLEGEAFWWFGLDYAGGIPNEIYVLDPRRMHHEGEFTGEIDLGFRDKPRRWFLQTGTELLTILQDEIIHFRDWNPWNPVRGVNPLVSLGLELEQDYYANRANSQLLKNNIILQGVLKTEQVLRPEEAELLERRWESKYGAVKAGRKIAVLGKGTSFEPLSFTPEVVKLFELKRWNLYTILAKYGIPPRVANISDRSTAFSGKDTAEQHSAFWKYTLIPILRQFEQILEGCFFMRLGLEERCVFHLIHG